MSAVDILAPYAADVDRWHLDAIRRRSACAACFREWELGADAGSLHNGEECGR